MATSHDSNRMLPHRERLSAALSGALVGDFFWGLALLGAIVSEFLEPIGPNWLSRFDVYDTVGAIFLVIASPVAVGGWLFVWGDNGPPYRWLDTAEFAVIFGLIFYGIIGATAGVLLARKRQWRLSTRAILLIAGVIAVAIGLAVTLRL